jgi:HEAT repeat protein
MSLFSSFGKTNVDRLRAKKDIKGLIKALSYRKDPKTCRDAIAALGELRDKRAVGPLAALLDDWNSEVCMAAADSLAVIEDVRAAGPLIASWQRLDKKIAEMADDAHKAGGELAGFLAGRMDPGLVSSLEQRGAPEAQQQLAQRLATAAVSAGIERQKELRDKVIVALRRIAKTDCGQNAEEWQQWWKDNREKLGGL